MKKTLLLAILLVSIISVQAVVKVVYVTLNKTTMDATATPVTNDPIIQVLKADPNFEVTVKVIATTDVFSDLGNYDVVIVQESNGGGDATLKPTGSLALKSIPKPFIYNKTYALKSTRALTTSSATGGVESTSLSITVDPTALTNDLFKGCTIGASNEIILFNAQMTDLGAPTGTLKSLNYSFGNVLTNNGTSINTILATPTVTTSTPAVAINDIPSGTSIDSETTIARMIALSMNFGAISGNGGKNITDDGLTIWRNAVYILGGLPVPATKATLPVGTGVNTLNNSSEVISVDYYNVNGIKVLDQKDLMNGIFVKRTKYQSGSVQSEKVVFVK